jgi:hypothetical protein
MPSGDMPKDVSVESRAAAPGEVRALLEAAARFRRDAALDEASLEARYLMAYESALMLATVALRTAAIRVKGRDNHRDTFRLLPVVIGGEAAAYAEYFDDARRRRNGVQYDGALVSGSRELAETLQHLDEFREIVDRWLTDQGARMSDA